MMPAKDRYHDVVRRALIKDGWPIVNEQIRLEIGRRRLWVDFQAQQDAAPLAILVEVKGFEKSPSQVNELAEAIGQYIIYQVALASMRRDLPLYLAVPQTAYQDILSEALGQQTKQYLRMKWTVFDPINEEIIL